MTVFLLLRKWKKLKQFSLLFFLLVKDVGAAVFMATATAMPELFTNMISTFVTDSDMGVGTIMGSLMFNILGVTSLSALLLPAVRAQRILKFDSCKIISKIFRFFFQPTKLDWWPLTRDCTILTINILFLLIFSWDGLIYFWEALILILLIVTYYIVMFNSTRLGHFVNRKISERKERKYSNNAISVFRMYRHFLMFAPQQELNRCAHQLTHLKIHKIMVHPIQHLMQNWLRWVKKKLKRQHHHQHTLHRQCIR